MKENDFDSIKEKFDNCGVTAPEALSEEAVVSLLPEQPLQALPAKKSKKKVVAGVSAAAACAVVTAGAITFTSMFHQFQPSPNGGGKTLFAQTAALRSFQSRDELQKELKKVLTLQNSGDGYWNRYGGSDIVYEYGAASDSYFSSSSASSSSGGSAAHNSTYIQSVGVDEADTVKTTDQYIFYCDSWGSNSIDIFTADGENAQHIVTLPLFEDDGWLENFYIVGDRLVVLGEVYEERGSNFLSEMLGDYFSPGGEEYTIAEVYDISDMQAIKKLNSFSQSGNYVDSRMIGDTLYLVSNQYFYGETTLPKVVSATATADSATRDEVPVSDIYAVENPVDNSFLVVSSVNVQNGAQVSKTKAILGSADIIYCNLQNLYVTARQYSPVVYDAMLRSYEAGENGETLPYDYETESMLEKAQYLGTQQTQIIKISLENDINFVASGMVNGTVNNQYSLDEYNGYLRVATTSYEIDSALNDDRNNLFVLDGNLQQVGAVTDFAYGESIKAVRYINDTAYVITYEQTDPLFVIDVSNPAAPQMMGEVKISGFSTMLVPVDENTLLGIGYHTVDHADDNIDMEIQEGVKIVTFDVTDKANPQVLDTKIYAGYDSVVQYDPHALLVNFERGDYTIPMHYYDYSVYRNYDVDAGTGEPETQETYGLLNFRVDNGKINVIDNYVSQKFITEHGHSDRCVYVGDNQYLLGRQFSNTNSADIECVPYK